MMSGSLFQRLLITVAALLLIATIAVFTGYRRVSRDPEMIMDLVQKKADMHLDKINQTASKNGIREWRMAAKSATLREEEKTMLLVEPDVEFFMSDGDIVHLKARQGEIYTDSNRMTVSGNVVANNRRYRFFTDTLNYDPTTRELRTETPVSLSGDVFTLTAGQMAMDLDTRVTRFDGGVEGTISDDIRL